jgi:hypothetical protein
MNEQDPKLTRQQRRALERRIKSSTQQEVSPIQALEIDRQLIIGEGIRRKIKPNHTEQRLWRGYDSMPAAKALPENFVEATITKLYTTFSLMKASANPVFHAEGGYIESLLHDGHIAATVPVELAVKSTIGTGGMGVNINNIEGKLIPVLHLPAQRILNADSYQITGYKLVHEATHIRSQLQRIAEKPTTLSNNEFLTQEWELVDNINTILPEEAIAYAKASEALITQFALGSGPAYGDDIKHAAMYLRSGRDTASPQWLTYVKSHLQTYMLEST